jgi:hypothetical protein
MLTGGRSRGSVAASMVAATLLDRAAYAMAAVGSPAVHCALAEACCPAEQGAVSVCPQCKGKGYQPHCFSRETLVKAALMRQQRAKRG